LKNSFLYGKIIILHQLEGKIMQEDMSSKENVASELDLWHQQKFIDIAELDDSIIVESYLTLYQIFYKSLASKLDTSIPTTVFYSKSKPGYSLKMMTQMFDHNDINKIKELLILFMSEDKTDEAIISNEIMLWYSQGDIFQKEAHVSFDYELGDEVEEALEVVFSHIVNR
jgi:hypothetical protein